MFDEPNNTTEEPQAESLGAEHEGVVPSAEQAAPADLGPTGENAAHDDEETLSPADVVPQYYEDDRDVEPLEVASDEDKPGATGQRHWYILKVQSNREDSIKDALIRNVKKEGMDDFFGDIIVPIEMVTEFKGGKKKVVKRKLYPGYIVVNMELNDDTWYLVRNTHGIGDFTGSGGKPSPMLPHEVARVVVKQEEKTDEAPKLKISFHTGDRVKITEGTFENFEGDVDTIDEANGRVTVMINIFGRSTPVELEYWQVETL